MWTRQNSTNIDWALYEFDGMCPGCDFCRACKHTHRIGVNHRCEVVRGKVMETPTPGIVHFNAPQFVGRFPLVDGEFKPDAQALITAEDIEKCQEESVPDGKRERVSFFFPLPKDGEPNANGDIFVSGEKLEGELERLKESLLKQRFVPEKRPIFISLPPVNNEYMEHLEWLKRMMFKSFMPIEKMVEKYRVPASLMGPIDLRPGALARRPITTCSICGEEGCEHLTVRRETKDERETDQGSGDD